MLTIISAAALPVVENGPASKDRTSLQVLPASGSEPTWPRLQGRVLFSLFGGNAPPIQFLQIENIFDQVPDDLLECWASCFWVIQACDLATSEHPIFRLDSLKERVYSLTGLASNELTDERIVHVMQQLGERFAGRLGLDATSVLDAHCAYVVALKARTAAPQE